MSNPDRDIVIPLPDVTAGILIDDNGVAWLPIRLEDAERYYLNEPDESIAWKFRDFIKRAIEQQAEGLSLTERRRRIQARWLREDETFREIGNTSQ